MDWQHDGALLWMDIEGYEGHALRGASNLLAAGIPIVCEYNTSYLENSGGMNWFREALTGRQIFDLKHGVKAEKIGLNELAIRYPTAREFTDILSISARVD